MSHTTTSAPSAGHITFHSIKRCRVPSAVKSSPSVSTLFPRQPANMNLMNGGHYVPVAWWVGSLGDHILTIIFGLLDEHREDTAQRAFPVIAVEALARME
jgi:hypothetical protein